MLSPGDEYDTERSRRALDDVLSSLDNRRILPSQLKFEDGITGLGGFGIVRRATWHKTKAESFDVAIKALIVLSGGPTAVRLALRFARELRVWCTVGHPNILPLLGFNIDFDIEKISAYFVSPYLSGGSIRPRLNLQAGASVDQRKQWILDITAGLLYLHTMKIGKKLFPVVHGDLKSDNILLDSKDRAVLCDFGLSSIMEDSEGPGLSTSDGFKGSLRWCSPELFEDKPRTTWSDIWAWSLCVLEILTNRVPFRGLRNDVAVMMRITQNKPPTRAEYPELLGTSELWDTLERCFQKEPTKRPAIQECWDRLGPQLSKTSNPNGFGLAPLGQQLIQNPDVLAPFFKTIQERNLIRHYVQASTKLMMALPSSLNPILTFRLPFILSSPPTELLTALNAPPIANPMPRGPPGSGSLSAIYQPSNQGNGPRQQSQSLRASVEAMRISLLGIASAHQAYLLLKSGPENSSNGAEMWNLSRSLRANAGKHVDIAVATAEGCRSDATLGAIVSNALTDIFMGGSNFAANLDLAKILVQIRGGPEAIVRHSRASTKGGFSAVSLEGPAFMVERHGTTQPSPNGATTSGETVLISSARLMLEVLTVYDTFSTLTSGQQPELLQPGNSAWWFEGDKSNYHSYSVETIFGMSRSIVEMFARVSAFLNLHRHPPGTESFVTGQSHLTPGSSGLSTPTASLAGLTEAPPPPGSPLFELHTEACTLLRMVQACETTTQSIGSMHPRIQYSNYAHKSALLILLLREAFNLPVNDSRVQKCAEMTLLAAIKASDHFVMSVCLNWPVIIAGSQCSNALRAMTIQLLEGFRSQCCFEIDTSQHILGEVWRRMDARELRADFRSVVEDLDLKVLIL